MDFLLILLLLITLITSALAQEWNCQGAFNTGRNCQENETCCGTNTMSTRCIAANSSDHCCYHYKASTQCRAGQDCCGGLGPGASSNAFCCSTGTKCCKELGYDAMGVCILPNQKCCSSYSPWPENWGCPVDHECGNSSVKCIPPPSSSPTSPSSPSWNCEGALNTGRNCQENETCCGTNTMSTRCIAANSSDHCCYHYKASTQCRAGQDCCGGLGPGASSSAFCCNNGTICCKDLGYSAMGVCILSNQKCCSSYFPSPQNWGCPEDRQCGNFSGKCISTLVPTSSPTPKAWVFDDDENGGSCRGILSFSSVMGLIFLIILVNLKY